MSEHLFRCPNGHLGRIDDDQLAGDVSIVCQGNYAECVGDGEVVGENYRECPECGGEVVSVSEGCVECSYRLF